MKGYFQLGSSPQHVPRSTRLAAAERGAGGEEKCLSVEPGALNLTLPPRKQFMGMGPFPISRPILHLAGEGFNLASVMDTTTVTLPTLPRASPSSMKGAPRVSGNGAAGQTKRQDRKAYFVLLT